IIQYANVPGWWGEGGLDATRSFHRTTRSMTMHPSPPDERLAAVTLEVLIRHSLVPSDPGWSVQVAPGGSTDRTFSVLDSAGTPRLTVRLARPGLADRLRHEQRVLNELAREPQNVALDLPGEDLVTVAPAPCEI